MNILKEINSAVWQISGKSPGPSILILGGIHGNETTGVIVIEKLREYFAKNPESVRSGTVTLALGNLEAIKQNSRGTEGRDLNRYFVDACESKPIDDSAEAQRATILAQYIRRANITIDLHATVKPSTPFICCTYNTQKNHDVARWFGADILLADPRAILSGTHSTTDDFAEHCGNIGICYEAGWIVNHTLVDSTMQSILNILGAQGVCATTPTKVLESPAQCFELTRRIVLGDQPFRFAEGMGTYSFQPVSKDAVIGFMGDQPILGEENSLIIFPKDQSLWAIGKPLFYLARRTPKPFDDQARGV